MFYQEPVHFQNQLVFLGCMYAMYVMVVAIFT